MVGIVDWAVAFAAGAVEAVVLFVAGVASELVADPAADVESGLTVVPSVADVVVRSAGVESVQVVADAECELAGQAESDEVVGLVAGPEFGEAVGLKVVDSAVPGLAADQAEDVGPAAAESTADLESAKAATVLEFVDVTDLAVVVDEKFEFGPVEESGPEQIAVFGWAGWQLRAAASEAVVALGAVTAEQ
jgi:hypothetical protein